MPDVTFTFTTAQINRIKSAATIALGLEETATNDQAKAWIFGLIRGAVLNTARVSAYQTAVDEAEAEGWVAE